MPHGKSVLLSSPSQPIIFISQGNNEIIVWDIEALLAVHRIEVEAPPKLMTKINDKLYVALESGIVLQIDTNSFSIENSKNICIEMGRSFEIYKEKLIILYFSVEIFDK